MAESDLERLLRLYDALGMSAVSDELFMVTIPGPPSSKSMDGKSGRRGRAELENTGNYLQSGVGRILDGNVGMACLFYRQNRQRIDTDNLLKHVCDAATGKIWNDDSQCTATAGIVELDKENPRTVVIVGKHRSSMSRGVDSSYPCVVCGGPIILEGQSGKPPKTCSSECRTTLCGYEPLSEEVPCAHCLNLFRRKTKTQRFCSQQCRIQSLKDKKRAEARPLSRCQDCDKELAHHRGGRCRDCWKLSIAHKRRAEPGETSGAHITLTDLEKYGTNPF